MVLFLDLPLASSPLLPHNALNRAQCCEKDAPVDLPGVASLLATMTQCVLLTRWEPAVTQVASAPERNEFLSLQPAPQNTQDRRGRLALWSD